MSSEFADIIDAALGLSENARASLAFRLFQSLKPPQVLEEAEPHFNDELDRRAAEYASENAAASTWDEVDSRLHQALRCEERS